MHCHAVHLPLGALLIPCTVCGAGGYTYSHIWQVLVFTDDIHFSRARRILAPPSGAPLPREHARVLASAKALELQTYARARALLLVSAADGEMYRDAVRHADTAVPVLSVLPFAAVPLAAAAVAPWGSRTAGRMLYVGTCHPVAKSALEWLVRRVLPSLSTLHTGSLQLCVVGNGWLHLASVPPFDEWVRTGVLQTP